MVWCAPCEPQALSPSALCANSTGWDGCWDGTCLCS